MLGEDGHGPPGSLSERFVRLDRRIYAPTGLARSLGSVAAIGRPPAGRRAGGPRLLLAA